EHSEGYRVLAYDLTTSGGQPRTLYPVEDTTRHPITPPQPCGQKRICLLDQSSFDSATIELVAIDADGKGQVWRRPVPEADQLMAIGDTVVVSGGTPMVVGFDRDGEVVFEQATGAAARINEGNLLVFGDEPWSAFGDMSLLGHAVEDHRLVALHTVRGIVATACSWGAATGEGYLACPTREAVTIWRFASDLRGGGVLSRRMSAASTWTVRGLSAGGCSASRIAVAPISSSGSRTVVSARMRSRAIGMSSIPTTDSCPGTSMPRSRATARTPMAMVSLKTARAVRS